MNLSFSENWMITKMQQKGKYFIGKNIIIPYEMDINKMGCAVKNLTSGKKGDTITFTLYINDVATDFIDTFVVPENIPETKTLGITKIFSEHKKLKCGDLLSIEINNINNVDFVSSVYVV